MINKVPHDGNYCHLGPEVVDSDLYHESGHLDSTLQNYPFYLSKRALANVKPVFRILEMSIPNL